MIQLILLVLLNLIFLPCRQGQQGQPVPRQW